MCSQKWASPAHSTAHSRRIVFLVPFQCLVTCNQCCPVDITCCSCSPHTCLLPPPLHTHTHQHPTPTWQLSRVAHAAHTHLQAHESQPQPRHGSRQHVSKPGHASMAMAASGTLIMDMHWQGMLLEHGTVRVVARHWLWLPDHDGCGDAAAGGTWVVHAWGSNASITKLCE